MPDTYSGESELPANIGYAGAAKMAAGGRLSRPTQTEQLEHKRKALEFELARVNAALDALKANPEIEKVLNLVQLAL